jgi:hypothetical protein
MGCVEKLNYEVLLRHCSFREAAEFIRRNTTEYYEVPPGFKIFDVHIIGVPPILVGIEGEDIIFPFTKPCHGTFLLRAAGGEEIESLRKRAKKVR